jgi:peptidyl-prolyl cis-trans isomerase C
MKQWFAAGLLCAGALSAQETPSTIQVPIQNAPPGTPPMTFNLVVNKPTDPNAVVAVVNGKELTAGWVDRMIRALPGVDESSVGQVDKKSFVERYAVLQLLRDAALKQKLDQQSPLKERIDYFMLTTLAQAVIDNENKGVVSEEQRKEYYEKTKEQFYRSKIRMILVRYGVQTEGGVKVHTKAEAKEVVDKIEAKLKSGAKFAEVAKEYSEEAKSKEDGGLYGWIKRSEKLPSEEMKSAIFALKPGEFSKPVDMLDNGYYIFESDETGYTPMREVANELDAGVKQGDNESVMRKAAADVKIEFKDAKYFTPPTAPQSPPKTAEKPKEESSK